MIKNRSPYIYLPLAFGLVLAAGIFLGTRLNRTTERIDRGKFDDVLDYVYGEYVDTVSKDRLTELALSLMLPHLDPHSSYISAADLKGMREGIEGNFEGVGIEFNLQRDTILVVAAITGGPSAKVGIRSGDRIVKINGKDVAGKGIKNPDVIKQLRGPKGTKVKVSIVRAGSYKKPIEFTIVRDEIPIFSIETSYMVDGDIGYIKLSRFSETTYDEFKKATGKLKSQGMRKLVLDLRDNPGGLLSTSIFISDEFLSKGKLIVYTEGRKHPREDAFATDDGSFEDTPLVILVDENSASASEIVAGAIQDNDRGTIVGRRTFGKGLVQTEQMLRDSSAIRLTIARYYTPTGRSIQKPYKNGVEDYYAEVGKRYDSGELEVEDSIKLNKSARYETPKGKVVYGGGGIAPDVFVPYDTSGYTPYYTALLAKGVIHDFALDYIDKNRTLLESKYKNSSAAFATGFIVDDAMLNNLAAFAAARGVPVNATELKKSSAEIKTNLKASIGRTVSGNEAAYRTWNANDKTFLKGIEVLKKQ